MTRLVMKSDAKPNTKAMSYYQSKLKRVLTREKLSNEMREDIKLILEFYATNPDYWRFPSEAKGLLHEAYAEINKRMAEDLTG